MDTDDYNGGHSSSSSSSSTSAASASASSSVSSSSSSSTENITNVTYGYLIAISCSLFELTYSNAHNINLIT